MTEIPSAARANFDVEEQRVRINQAIAESEKFSAEQHKLIAEAAKLYRDRALAPWQIVVGTSTATAALIGAGVALGKLFGA